MRSFATLILLMLSNAILRSTWSVEILGMNGGISYLLENQRFHCCFAGSWLPVELLIVPYFAVFISVEVFRFAHCEWQIFNHSY